MHFLTRASMSPSSMGRASADVRASCSQSAQCTGLARAYPEVGLAAKQVEELGTARCDLASQRSSQLYM